MLRHLLFFFDFEAIMSDLSMKNLHEYFEYSDGTLIRIKKNGRGRGKIGESVGFKEGGGYLQFRFKDKYYRLHRQIWIYHNGEIPWMM